MVFLYLLIRHKFEKNLEIFRENYFSRIRLSYKFREIAQNLQNSRKLLFENYENYQFLFFKKVLYFS